MIEKKEFKTRVERLQAAMKRRRLDAMIVTERFNAYYLTGFESSLSYLLLTPKRATLLVDGRYIEAARKAVRHCEVELFKTLGASLKKWAKGAGPKRIGFEGAVAWSQIAQFKTMLSGLEWQEAGGLILEQRLVKSPAEIALMEASARLNDEIYEAALAAARPGAREIDLRNVIRAEADRRGAEGLSFEAIVATGAAGSMPHYRAGKNRLRAGDFLLIDMGMLLNHYCSDMTRVVGLGRKHPARLRKAFDAVLEAHNAALAQVGPGVKTADLHRIAAERIARRGFGRYFTHGLGHGVGLEIHEAPRLNLTSNEVLKPGMVVTIEPGVYLPGLGGVRIEDMAAVTRSGHRSLCHARKTWRKLPFDE